jgi:aminoglycoside phosphotransferase (APT) family kinase protein
MSHLPIDSPAEVRAGEELDLGKLSHYLTSRIAGINPIIQVLQFPGGYSNLTYLIETKDKEYVLRKSPAGANIKSAHDMVREFKVISKLHPVYRNVPAPILLCEDEQILGSPFYIMERVKGLILRNKIPDGIALNKQMMLLLSQQMLDNLTELHALDIHKTGLVELGKPEGYVQRQVEGWTKRYFNAETTEIIQMNQIAEWLQGNLPPAGKTSFIHNDYKYDNLVLNPDTLAIKAVLDWEMATIGDPLMDLGTTLAYWAEPDDSPALKPFNLTWIPGNLNRQQIADRYCDKTGDDPQKLVFYYVFGSFKVAVIAQQIYARFKQGFTKDPRFANLIYVVQACASNGTDAIRHQRINDFH